MEMNEMFAPNHMSIYEKLDRALHTLKEQDDLLDSLRQQLLTYSTDTVRDTILSLLTEYLDVLSHLDSPAEISLIKQKLECLRLASDVAKKLEATPTTIETSFPEFHL